MLNRIAAIALALAGPLAAAQDQIAFPATAEPVTGEALHTKFAGKVFRMTGTTTKPAKLQYNSNGFVYLDVSTGFRDTGKWRVEGQNVCTEWRQSPTSGCAEARVAGDVVYVKRSTGEVVTLTPE